MIDYKDWHLLVSVSHRPGNIFQTVLVTPSEYIFECKLFSYKWNSQRKICNFFFELSVFDSSRSKCNSWQTV